MIINEMLNLFLQVILSGILRAVLTMSAIGSVLALILFALKTVLTKLEVKAPSKAAQYWVWKIVLTAFLVPFFLFVSVPIRTPTTDIQSIIKETIVPNYEMPEEIGEEHTVIVEDTDAQQRNEFRSQWWLDCLKLITLGVSVVLFVTTRIKYRIFSRKLRLARLPARKEEAAILQKLSLNKNAPALYRNPLVPTAMLVGVFRPAIYLPNRDYSETQLENILLHELIHYRRRDVLVKWLSALLTQLHWFNPLVYLVRRELNRICELSCDAAAIKDFDNQRKQDYGDTLIFAATEGKFPNFMISTAMCKEKKDLKDRLTAIMSSEKVTRGTMVYSCAFAALTVCITVVFAAAPNTRVIDPSSVTSASVSFVSHYTATQAADEYDEWVVSDEDLDELLSLVNSYSKSYYWSGYVPPFGDSRDNSDYRVRIDQTDGGYYILHYWYWNSFSVHPLHFGEDDYCSLLTYFDAKGNIGTTWKIEYDFDGPFYEWLLGAQRLAKFEKAAAKDTGTT